LGAGGGAGVEQAARVTSTSHGETREEAMSIPLVSRLRRAIT
jgi:hypothetical protein